MSFKRNLAVIATAALITTGLFAKGQGETTTKAVETKDEYVNATVLNELETYGRDGVSMNFSYTIRFKTDAGKIYTAKILKIGTNNPRSSETLALAIHEGTRIRVHAEDLENKNYFDKRDNIGFLYVEDIILANPNQE